MPYAAAVTTTTFDAPPVPRRWLPALGFGAAALGAGALGVLTMFGEGRPDGAWFQALKKPWFQPPNYLFGPVWTVLYGMIAYSGYRVWKQPASPGRTRALKLWGAQLALNALWTPLFFGAQRPDLALVDIVALDAAVLAYAATAAKVDRPAAGLMVPYMGWIAFATALTSAIVLKNRE